MTVLITRCPRKKHFSVLHPLQANLSDEYSNIDWHDKPTGDKTVFTWGYSIWADTFTKDSFPAFEERSAPMNKQFNSVPAEGRWIRPTVIQERQQVQEPINSFHAPLEDLDNSDNNNWTVTVCIS